MEMSLVLQSSIYANVHEYALSVLLSKLNKMLLKRPSGRKWMIILHTVTCSSLVRDHNKTPLFLSAPTEYFSGKRPTQSLTVQKQQVRHVLKSVTPVKLLDQMLYRCKKSKLVLTSFWEILDKDKDIFVKPPANSSNQPQLLLHHDAQHLQCIPLNSTYNCTSVHSANSTV